MLRSVRIENFQSHTDSRFVFSPGFNVLVGPTDEGKSSALRAVRWVVENRPIGKTIHTYGSAGTTSVRMRLLNDAGDAFDTVKRVKDRLKATKNFYFLNGTKFAAFGMGVPEAIVDILSFHGFLNYQKQSEPFFLLGLSSGVQRGQIISKFCDMALGDIAIKSIQHDIKVETVRLDVTRRTILQERQAIEELKPLPSLRIQMDEALALGKHYESGSKAVDRLRRLLIDRKTATQALVDAPTTALAAKGLSSAVKSVREAGKAKSVSLRLSTLLLAHDKIEKKLKQAHAIDVSSIQEIVLQGKRLQKVSEDLTLYLYQLAIISRDMKEAQEAMTKAKQELSTIKVCPLCNRKLP